MFFTSNIKEIEVNFIVRKAAISFSFHVRFFPGASRIHAGISVSANAAAKRTLPSFISHNVLVEWS